MGATAAAPDAETQPAHAQVEDDKMWRLATAGGDKNVRVSPSTSLFWTELACRRAVGAGRVPPLCRRAPPTRRDSIWPTHASEAPEADCHACSKQLWLVYPRPAPPPAPLVLVPSTSKLPSAPQPTYDGGPRVEYLATLKQHTGVVNVVRWCPVGSSPSFELAA